MNRLVASLVALMLLANAAPALSQDTPPTETTQDRGFADIVNSTMQPISDFISAVVFYPVFGDSEAGTGFPIIVLWLVAGALFFTFRMNFVNLTGLRQSLKIVSGKYDNPNDPGEVTHFQALSAAVSGTVGLGNIAGVAVAVSVGGPGATFWMIMAGIFGMTSKFVECTLGVKYRTIDENGVVAGGPMYYLSRGLDARGMPGLGKVLAAAAAIICIGGAYGAGALFQVNQSATQFTNEIAMATGGADSFFYGKGWIFGAAFALVLALVVIGGIKSITRVTSRLVPLMALIYVTSALLILLANFTAIPDAFGQIISGAFTADGVKGGFIGCLIQGLRRASFSNEAGLGSAAIAHAAARTKEPIAEGHVALLEPFIDTVVICTLTALVIIVTGSLDANANGILLTSKAFATLGSFMPTILTIAVVLFAFSTSLTWFYYGQKGFSYLAGDSKLADWFYKFSFLGLLIVGSAMNLGPVMDIADSLLLAMAFPNIVGLVIMSGEVRAMLDDYRHRLKAGQIPETT